MRRSYRTRPNVDPLEERALLSHLGWHAAHAHPVHVSAAPVSFDTTRLHGTLAGQYTITPTGTAVGVEYSIAGSGTLVNLGNVKVTGVVESIQVRGKLQLLGSLTISEGRSTFTLRLTGLSLPPPLASGALAGHPESITSNLMWMRYTIVSGTGSFKNLHGTGLVSLALLPLTVPPITPPGTMPPVSVPPGTTPPVTTPPVSAPPVTNPPILPPIGLIPPTSVPHAPMGPPSSTGIRPAAVPITPVLGPTFLHGRFLLTFNGVLSILPPWL
jgi:hypothetical protein